MYEGEERVCHCHHSRYECRGDTECINCYVREMHLLPKSAWRLLIEETVVTNMPSLYPGCSVCLKRPLWSSLLGFTASLFNTLPQVLSSETSSLPLHCPSSLLCADLGQLPPRAGLQLFIFLARSDFQVSQRPLQGNTRPEKCPFPTKGAEVMTFPSLGIWATRFGAGTGIINITGHCMALLGLITQTLQPFLRR